MARENPPTAPVSLPKYVAEGLPNQDLGTLHDVQAFVDELIEYEQRPVEPDDLSENAEVVEKASEKGWIIEEYVTCGTETCHCANPDDPGHGPTNIGIGAKTGNCNQNT